MDIYTRYKSLRQRTEDICRPLAIEDYVVQPIVDVSPPKWHLGHTTWFFETFILTPHVQGYQPFNPDYNYVFNSYYETIGNRVIRTDRGNLSRPTVDDIYRYRQHVDEAILKILSAPLEPEVSNLIVLGIHHEEQHQELLYTDIKYILGHNPLFPAYDVTYQPPTLKSTSTNDFIRIKEGLYEIGFKGDGFCFDNELGRHKAYLNEFEISNRLVSNAEYLEFINDGGYSDFRHWHAEGWDWVRNEKITAPLYWHFIDNSWYHYTFRGLEPIDLEASVRHVSYFEAYAYAAWKGLRLPTEFEWEVAAPNFTWGENWEWTESAYLPYPGFKKAPGAIGEYNGKFMVNQKVLRGASAVTSPGHSRLTYRNFFQTNLRWQFTGIRLAK
ncbi:MULTISPECIES: ergothioneine biosynthesis protein EgtB [Olivibacter]|jgi:ergothioneine biosynthesis protein EgtB|uniref:Ergothioneine biosynthesis protein EgtB n=1 Tax=Olivibacter oleidegradans TaxID=760123 RepID=A0ABV6HS40_9SPHI|nr:MULTISPECIES: ergothioneine biosynthesis protein EgtB [unclassified Olivibacter]MDM8176348.1 ergothioneine biosynthesis protein EgtB [Olivibacter sp. 47]QEL01164.1 ergothioneine biosynthesis protein EgtB [Olivibacter sp. LS-1]